MCPPRYSVSCGPVAAFDNLGKFCLPSRLAAHLDQCRTADQSGTASFRGLGVAPLMPCGVGHQGSPKLVSGEPKGQTLLPWCRQVAYSTGPAAQRIDSAGRPCSQSLGASCGVRLCACLFGRALVPWRLRVCPHAACANIELGNADISCANIELGNADISCAPRNGAISRSQKSDSVKLPPSGGPPPWGSQATWYAT